MMTKGKTRAILREWRKRIEFSRYKEPPRVFFNHIPKCAGTTVNSYLMSHFPHRRIFHSNVRDAQSSISAFAALSEQERHSFHLICGHHVENISELIHPETFRFTILREPVDRIVSLYHYILQEPTHYLYRDVVAVGSLSAFAEMAQIRNWLTHTLSGFAHDSDNEALAAATEHLRSYDLIGFSDDVGSALGIVRGAVGLKRQFKYSAINRTKSRQSLSDIDATTLGSIRKANELDLRLYASIRG